MPQKRLAIAMLAIVAVYHGVRAAGGGDFWKVDLAVGGFALVLALIVAVRKEPLPEPVRRPRSPALRAAGGWMAAAGAIGGVLWWLYAPWMPQADFDVIGFLFLLQNVWQLLVMAALVAVTAVGAGLWWENRP